MRNYKKFSNEELLLLEKSFKQCSFYPTRDKIKKLARALKTQSSKIDNWFKYKRRKMYYSGKFSQYKIRKIFAKDENEELNLIFESTQKPNFQKCKEIAQSFEGVSAYQIKNWFSNRRRKLRNDLKKKHRSLIRRPSHSKQCRTTKKQVAQPPPPPQPQDPLPGNGSDDKINGVKTEVLETSQAPVPFQDIKVEAVEDRKEEITHGDPLQSWAFAPNPRFTGGRVYYPNTEMINFASYRSSQDSFGMGLSPPADLNMLQYGLNFLRAKMWQQSWDPAFAVRSKLLGISGKSSFPFVERR